MVVQSLQLIADLRDQNQNIGDLFICTGLNTPGDNYGGMYLWEPLNVTPDDGFYSLQVTGVSVGRWIRIGASTNIYTSDGSLISTRTLTNNGYDLTFSGSGYDTVFQADGHITAGSLAGVGSRYVVAGPTGLLGTFGTMPDPGVPTRFIERYVASAGQTTFTTANTLYSTFFDVYVNGSLLDLPSYTASSNQIVLNEPCSADDILEVIGFINIQYAIVLPSIVGQAGKFLTNDGTTVFWAPNPLGTVTNVSFTTGTSGTDVNSSVIDPTTTPSITLNIPVASATNTGKLSSADWTTFNNKQNQITLTTIGNSGASTFISDTLNVPTYTLSGLGGVPTSRTLTINGVSYDLSADRTWTVIAGISSVTGTSPISVNTVSGAATVSISQSSSISDGYLSSTDWNYFDSKQNAITLTTIGSSGPATFISNTLNIPDYSSALSGYVPTSRTLTINGTSYDLTVNRSWSVGTVTSVSLATDTSGNDVAVSGSPVTGASTITLSIPFASATATGKLSSTDWITFNSKQNALTLGNLTEATSSILTITGGTGAVVGSGVTIQVALASGSQSGYLSSTDWTTFNNKQNAITLTTTGSSGAATFISDTLNIPNYTLSGLGGVPSSRTLTINGTAHDLSADRTWSVGTVTSVGLSMPAAFTVSNSPVTGSGTLTVTGAGTASQYVRGDGSLGDFPAGGGGGSSVSYYLNGGTSQGTFGGVTYYELSTNAVSGTAADFNINTNGYIASFITDANDPSLLEIPAGNWNIEFYFSASSAGGSPSFYVELYKYDGTTFTFINSNSANPEIITNGTTVDTYFTSVSVPLTPLAITDRLAVRVYVNNSGRTITLHTQDNHLSQIITTFSRGLTALNGLTKSVQYLTTGTSGSDFNISSATDTHTFNLPVASATNTGKLSSTDWITFNSKQNALTFGNLTEATSSVLTISGGTGAVIGSGTSIQVSQSGASTSGYLSSTDWNTFNSKLTNPMTTLGDIIYGGASGVATRLAGNTTTSLKFLSQTGTGTSSSVPVWAAIDGGDIAGYALTKTDDTNVTLTLGGTPSTALLKSVSLTLGWTGQLSISRGGTNASTKTAAFDNLSPMIALGDTIYGGVSGTGTRLAGNTTTTKQYLSQTGDGTNSAAPIWSTIVGSDITGAALTSTDDTNVTLTLGGSPSTSLLRATSLTLGWTGILATTRGGTGLNSYTLGDTLYASAANTLAKLSGNTTTTKKFLSQTGTGTISAAPSWEAISSSDIPLTLTTTGTSGASTYSSGTGILNIPIYQGAITLTTTGTSGPATLVGTVLNIPQYQTALTNPVTGTGTLNYVSKFTGTSSIGDSQIFDNGSFVGINVASGSTRFAVNGSSLLQHTYTHTTGSFTSGLNSQAIVTTAASPSYTSGMFYGAFSTYYQNEFAGSATIPSSVVIGSQFNQSQVRFTNASTAITLTQGSLGARAIANQTLQFSFLNALASCSVSHVAGSLILAPYYTGSNNPTITNYYGIVLNDSSEYSTYITVTNRWGIYQMGASDKNYFAGNTLIGTTALSSFSTPKLTLYGGNYTVSEVRADTEARIQLTTDVAGSTPYVELVNSYGNFFVKVSNTGTGSTYPMYYNGSSATNRYLKFQTNGSDALLINQSGNVSIGNTNDTYKLDVSGTGRFTGALSGTSATFNAAVSSATEYRLNTNSYSRVAILDGGGGFAGGYNFNINSSTAQHDSTGASSGYWYTTSGTILLYTNASAAAGTALTARVTIGTTGNVTLTGALSGTSATFSDTVSVSNPSSWGLIEVKGSTSTQGGQIDFYGSTTRYASVAGEYESATNGKLLLRTRNAGTLTTALTLASTGAATFSSSVTAGSVLVDTLSLGTDGTYGGTYKTLGFTGNTNGSHRIFAGTSDDLYIASATGRGIRFWTNGSSGNVMTITSGGNVGIGTSSPTANINGSTNKILDITSSNFASLLFHGSTAQESSIAGGTNGLYIDVAGHATASNNVIVFRTGDTNSSYSVSERMRITSGGLVGIGTTSPSAPLTVSGNISLGNRAVAGTSYIGKLREDNGGITNAYGIGFVNSDINGAGYINFYTTPVGGSGDTRMTITGAGSVGIGNTNPSVRFEVNNTINTTYSSSNTLAGGVISYIKNTSTTNSTDATIRLEATGAGNLAATSISAVHTGTGSSALTFGTRLNSGDVTERMRIDASGSVGIGTTSPGQKLTVDGAGASTYIQLIGLSRNLYLGQDSIGAAIYSDGSVPMYFATNGTEKMRITSGGNVLIGDTSDYLATKLYIKSAGTTNSTNIISCLNSAGTEFFRVRSDGYTYAYGVYSNTTASAANVFVGSGGDFLRSTSSIKYKKNVTNYTKGLAEVMSLRPVNYQGKNEIDGNKVFAGLIAEEVHELGLTEFVQYAEDGSPDALAYQNMVALLTKAIQELKAELDTLKNK